MHRDGKVVGPSRTAAVEDVRPPVAPGAASPDAAAAVGDARSVGGVALAPVGGIVAGVAVLAALYLTSLHSYLLFHTLIELFTVTVAAGVFVIAWNARAYLENGYLLFVGIASIFVALVDLFHALAYEGMGVLAGGGSAVATQLWIAARSLQAAAFLLAPFFLGRRLRVNLVLAVFGIATAVLLALILYWRAFPTCYVEGVGLTPFKIGAEYVVSLAFVAGTVLLFRKRESFDRRVLHLLAGALVLSVGAELTFTTYVSVVGGPVLLGHFLRLVASYLLYKAIIETGLVKPFAILLRELKRSESRLRDYALALESTNDELRRSETRLRERAADLEIRNQELDSFARTVAHDLKGPLAIIVANAELVAEGPGRDRDRTLLRRIGSTAGSMSDIIDHLLLLSEVRTGEVPREVVDMAAVVARVQDRLRELIHAHDAELTVAEEWPVALGYGPWIEEVWANYITNALKYGGRPPRIRLGASERVGETVRFWIRDNGPGIAPEDRPGLFVPFHRLAAGSRPGHGLGLSIVVQIVEKLGGRAGVESVPGEGSEFFFTLPVAAVSGPGSGVVQEATPDRPPRSDLEGVTGR